MSEDHSVRQRRVLDASIERVWDAWTQPALMLEWFCPLGMTTTDAVVALRVGGRFRITMAQGPQALPTPPEFGPELVAEGTYEQVERPRLLGFTWTWVGWDEVSRVRINLRTVERGTELLLVHCRLRTEESQMFHEAGWHSTLENLCLAIIGPSGARKETDESGTKENA